MKKLLLLPLLLSLSACVTYYTPEGVEESGVYYIEDAPGYVANLSSNANADYYPWSSLDTFYLGDGDYPGYGYGSGGFSFGVSMGYSPWYYPHYSHYSAGFDPYYSPYYQPYYPYYYRPHYSGWWPNHGYCARTNACGHGRNRHHPDDDRQGRFTGVDGPDRHPRGGDDEDGNEDPGGRHDGSGGRTGDHGEAPVRRYVTTAPSGSAGNRGLVVRNRGNSKPGKSHLEPVHTTSGQAVSAPVTTRRPQRRPATSGTTRQPQRQPVASGTTRQRQRPPATSIDRSRRGAGEVRYRSGAKPGRARIEPVKSTVPLTSITVAKEPGTRPARSPSRAVSRPPSRSANKANVNKSGRSYSHAKTSASRQSRHASRVNYDHRR